jgi:hypothetical protein
MEKVFTQFEQALVLGKYNEHVIAHEFAFQGIPVQQTEGKDDFDFYLPDGRSVEVKMDIRSQCTGAGAIEWPTLQRHADFYIHTLTYARVFPHALYQALFNRGKIPDGGFGPQGYDGRYIRNLGREGQPLWEFIKQLREQMRQAA